MNRARRSAMISQRYTQVWETRIKLLPGWKKIFRLAVDCWPGRDGHQPSSRSAQTRASPTSCGAWDSSYEDRQFLGRAEAAQRLQSCGRVRGHRLAVDSSSVDFLSSVQCAAMGDANCHPHSCGWVLDCPGVFLGVRGHVRGK